MFTWMQGDYINRMSCFPSVSRQYVTLQLSQILKLRACYFTIRKSIDLSVEAKSNPPLQQQQKILFLLGREALKSVGCFDMDTHQESILLHRNPTGLVKLSLDPDYFSNSISIADQLCFDFRFVYNIIILFVFCLSIEIWIL